MLNVLQHTRREDANRSTPNHLMKHMALSVAGTGHNNTIDHHSTSASGSQSNQMNKDDLTSRVINSNGINTEIAGTGVKRNADGSWITLDAKKKVPFISAEHSYDAMMARFLEDNKHLRVKYIGAESTFNVNDRIMKQLANAKATSILAKQLAKPGEFRNFMFGDPNAKTMLESSNGGRLKLTTRRLMLHDRLIPEGLIKPNKGCVLFLGPIVQEKKTGSKKKILVGSIGAYLDPSLDDGPLTKLVQLPNAEGHTYEAKSKKKVFAKEDSGGFQVDVEVAKKICNYGDYTELCLLEQPNGPTSGSNKQSVSVMTKNKAPAIPMSEVLSHQDVIMPNNEAFNQYPDGLTEPCAVPNSPAIPDYSPFEGIETDDFVSVESLYNLFTTIVNSGSSIFHDAQDCPVDYNPVQNGSMFATSESIPLFDEIPTVDLEVLSNTTDNFGTHGQPTSTILEDPNQYQLCQTNLLDLISENL